ncbi:MAG TPA: fatty acid desaturase [Acidimicrobiales bacterium]|nr:fatty acid desaturase [Acidimicrobiales bacterium]
MLSVAGAVLAGLVIAQVALMVTTVYLHRCLSHRALRLTPGALAVCRVLTWMLTGMRPRQWVAVHRKHHAFTDTERDPHSPVVLGFAKVQLANAVLYRKVARDPSTVARYARDLPADRWDRWLFDHAFVGLGLGIGALVLLFGWQLALVAAGVHAAYYLLGGGAINAVGHRWGRRPFDNLATNNQWLAWLVVGEGLHNNHHAAATSSRLSLAKGEFDPGWWCIRLLVRLRCATLRHVDLVPRAPAPLG